MLLSLRVRDLALFESAELQFADGFCALTGETGAGKSLIVDALQLITGKKASPDLIRTGADYLEVAAVFDTLDPRVSEQLASLGLTASDGGIELSRRLDRAGKNTCRIDGKTTSLSVLKAASRVLLDVHEQQEAHGLLDRKNHLSYLDAFCAASSDFAPSLQAYRALYQTYREKREIFSKLYEKREKGLKEREFTSFQIEELEKARIRVGEYRKLTEQKTRLKYAQKIGEATHTASAALFEGSPNALDLIRDASNALSAVGEEVKAFAESAKKLDSLSYEIEEVLHELAPYQSDEAFAGMSLDEIEERLSRLDRLFKLYAPTEQGLIDYLENLKREEALLEDDSEEAKKLHAEAKEAMRAARAGGAKLSELRRAGAKELEARILRELAFLDLNKVRFRVEFAEKEKMDPDGIDDVSFFIGTNPGEPEMPLERIASGGELSRILLALRCVLAGLDEIGTLVFDEIDTGISGKSAQKIGIALKRLGKVRQVLCVTHSAQVASCANEQMKVEKFIDADRTYAAVRTLNEEGRLQELARILGGARVSDVTLANAKELLLQGQK